MPFTHKPCKLPKIWRSNRNGTRVYRTPNGRHYLSVTAMLSRTKDMSGLVRWKESVGYDVAEYILDQAGIIGSATHETIEMYLRNEKDVMKSKPLLARAHFDNIRKYLDKISDIRGLEVGLYSDDLKLAGTADCIAKYDGMLSVIDFKTARTMKKEEWIEDYFIQTCAYSYMYQEHIPEQIKQIVIIMSAEGGQRCVFTKNPLHYKKKLFERIALCNT